MRFSTQTVKDFLADRFSLHEDSAHEAEIIDSIRRNVEFKGSNLWALIFAIFIASIGLNVNSTAVIIGAMLVSPLMGPIMGLGLGIGINDIDLIRKSIKNLLIAVIISVGTSTLYFLLTPLHEAQSELLARTTPSLWDVFIAFFGGLAGIVGSTRREKGNVIPGVAIATALMPPLCTAGYGLASWNAYYLLGAVYLFFINSVFICISTLIMVRYMKLPRKAFPDKGREKRVTRYIFYVVVATAMPSIYLAYRIVDKSIFERNARKFIKSEVNFPNTHIINKVFKHEHNLKEINLLLIGQEISKETIDSLKTRLSAYNLAGVNLVLSQGLNNRQFDYSQIKANIVEDIIAKQQEMNQAQQASAADDYLQAPDFRNDLKALYPNIKTFSVSRNFVYNFDSTSVDTVVLFLGYFSSHPDKREKIQLKNWLKNRIKTDSVTCLVQSHRNMEAL